MECPFEPKETCSSAALRLPAGLAARMTATGMAACWSRRRRCLESQPRLARLRWKATTAPSTGLGGVAESVARTITGRKFWPTVEAWFPPDKASSLSDEAGTANAEKLWQGLLPGCTQALTCKLAPSAGT